MLRNVCQVAFLSRTFITRVHKFQLAQSTFTRHQLLRKTSKLQFGIEFGAMTNVKRTLLRTVYNHVLRVFVF